MNNERLYEQIDEAMVPLHEHLGAMLEVDGLMTTADDSIRMEITEIGFESPLQLDIVLGENGDLVIGSSPPLYYLETGIIPVFHAVKCRIVVENPENMQLDES